MSLTIAENGSATLSEARHFACLEVAYELEALALLLPGLVPNIDEAHGAHHAVRGISGRLVSLAGALMAGLGDEVEKTEKISRKVLVSAWTGQG